VFAGQGAPLTRALPAASLIETLAAETTARLREIAGMVV
jgi:hypothetical protein